MFFKIRDSALGLGVMARPGRQLETRKNRLILTVTEAARVD
jgi:hypothetical protein